MVVQIVCLSRLYPRCIDYELEAEAMETGLQATYDYQLADDAGVPIKSVAVKSVVVVSGESASG